MNLFTKAVQAASELLAKSDVAGHWRTFANGRKVYVRPYTTARQAETRHAVRHGLEPGDTLADEAGSRGTVSHVTDTHVHTDQDTHPIDRVAERIHNGDLTVHRGGKEMTREHLALHAKKKIGEAEEALTRHIYSEGGPPSTHEVEGGHIAAHVKPGDVWHRHKRGQKVEHEADWQRKQATVHAVTGRTVMTGEEGYMRSGVDEAAEAIKTGRGNFYRNGEAVFRKK